MDIALIANKKAKNAALLSHYVDALSLTEHQIFEAEPENIADIIEQCKKKYPLLFIGGGDGTVRTAAQLCANTRTILGVLPLGTMNHFSKELGLPSHPEEVAQALHQRKTITIDLAEVNQNVFINNSSIGFYSKFAKHRDRYNKFYNKWLCYFPGLIQAFKFHETLTIQLENSDIGRSLRTSFIMISNNKYSYQFPMSFKRETFNKGLLGVYYVKHAKLYVIDVMGALIYRKAHFVIEQTKEPIKIHIKNKKAIIVALDGDAVLMESPLIFKPLPNALTLLTR